MGQRIWLTRRFYDLPGLREAMREGRISYEKARLVAGCADENTVAHARGRSPGCARLGVGGSSGCLGLVSPSPDSASYIRWSASLASLVPIVFWSPWTKLNLRATLLPPFCAMKVCITGLHIARSPTPATGAKPGSDFIWS